MAVLAGHELREILALLQVRSEMPPAQERADRAGDNAMGSFGNPIRSPEHGTSTSSAQQKDANGAAVQGKVSAGLGRSLVHQATPFS